MELRYKHIETALAQVFEIPDDEVTKAFRARLRHLRNLGLPHLPSPGSGQQIAYSRDIAIQILVALEVGNLGWSPRHAVHMVGGKPMQHVRDFIEKKEGCFIMVVPDQPDGHDGGSTLIVANEAKDVVDRVKTDIRFSFSNIGVLVSRLDAALSRISS